MMHAMLFDAPGAEVVLADISNERLDFARIAGIKTTINPKDTSLRDYVAKTTSCQGRRRGGRLVRKPIYNVFGYRVPRVCYL